MAPINPFDFFIEDGAANWPFAYAGTLAGELRPISRRARRAHLRRLRRRARRAPARRPIDFVCDLNRRLSADIAYRMRMEPGVQTPARDAGEPLGLLPRLRLAAGADAAPPRPRRPLRVGLPDPAAPRVRRRGRPGAARGLRRPARLGRGLHPRRRLDRARSDLRPARGRGPHPPRRDAHADSAAPITGTHGEGKVEFSATMPSRASREAARSRALQRGPVAGDPRRGRRRGRAARSRRRAPQHGRRADLRRRSTTAGRPSGTSPRSARPSASTPTSWRAACASACALAACCTTARASGIRASRPRAGPSRIYWRSRRRAAVAGPEPDRRGGRGARGTTSAMPSSFAGELCRTLGLSADSPIPAYEDCGPLHAERAEAAARRRAREQPARRGSGAGAHDAGLRSRACAKPVGHVLPLLAARDAPASAGS